MYSVVLMAALTTGSATPDFCWHRCHGCHGCHGCHRCHGCHGCWHCCHGCYGCHCWCSCYCSGWCHGYCSSYGCYCSCYSGCCYGVVVVPYAAPAMTPAPVTKPGNGVETAPLPKKQEQVQNDRARVIVQVPADAKLYIDGHAMKTSSTRRVFSTPQLQPGQAYYYEVRAEVEREGQRLVETQRVILRPGQQVTASFTDLENRANALVRSASR